MPLLLCKTLFFFAGTHARDILCVSSLSGPSLVDGLLDGVFSISRCDGTEETASFKKGTMHGPYVILEDK